MWRGPQASDNCDSRLRDSTRKIFGNKKPHGGTVILKVGQTLASAIDTTAVIVVRAPKNEVALTCGGVDMVAGKSGLGDGSGIDDAHRGGALLGKRYVDEDAALEVLCTKAGD